MNIALNVYYLRLNISVLCSISSCLCAKGVLKPRHQHILPFKNAIFNKINNRYSASWHIVKCLAIPQLIFSPDNQCLASAFSRVILLFMNHAPHFLKPNTPFRELKIHPIHPPTHDLFHQNHTPTDNEKTAIFGVGEGEIMPKNDLSEVATGGDGTKKRTKSLAL